MLIRDCRASDLDLLERAAPSGLNNRHVRRFEEQAAGQAVVLVAFRDGTPLGACALMWGARMPTVRKVYPDCPEINGLDVFQAELRGQGIGSALIGAAEERAREAGRARIGLGVADDNPRAAGLYSRLGYRPGIRYNDEYVHLDDSGVEHFVSDPATFLLKDLYAGASPKSGMPS
jgi:GNAT superfamily N-acetyltransferase